MYAELIGAISNFMYGKLLIIMLIGVGLYYTFRTRFIQLRLLGETLRVITEKKADKNSVSSFQALMVSTASRVGTGNIIGVSTALCLGGFGSMFWMWLAALFGMATKYSEGLLAVKYRSIDKNTGHVLGGPFYYIERGMGKRLPQISWRWLAKIFAFFGMCVGLFGIGTFTQVNSINGAITNFFDPDKAASVTILGMNYSWATVIGGIVLAILVGLVVIGGIKRIASVSERIIPAMVVLYVGFSIIVLLANLDKIPGAFVVIFESAFGLRAAAGGALGAIIIAMQKGIARGIFSNEAGLGSAPIAAAAAQTKEPVRQGLVSMTGTFLDTIIVCTMTGLTIVMTGAYQIPGLEGAAITTTAFQTGLPFIPSQVVAFVLMACLALFGFTTILGWDYYGERCLEYLSNGNLKAVKVYRWLYIAAVFIGPYMTVSAVWTIADIFNACMAVPNMIALIVLSGVVARETKDFFKRLKNADGNEDKMEPHVDYDNVPPIDSLTDRLGAKTAQEDTAAVAQGFATA